MEEAEHLTRADPPRRRWRVGRYEFHRIPRSQVPHLSGRWGVSDGQTGTGFCKTPLGAWLAHRRWKHEALTAPPCGEP